MDSTLMDYCDKKEQTGNLSLPTISIIIPTLNSEKSIDKCLASISSQDYPKENIEIIIVDGGSRDSTIKKTEPFNTKIIIKEDMKDNQEQRRAVGLLNAKNDIVAFIDSDNILPHSLWLTKMVEPLRQNKNIVATQPLRYTYNKHHSLLNRYFALFGVNDPIPYYFNKRDRLSWMENEWRLFGEAEDMGNYFLVKFDPKAVPTLGANGFLVRRDILLKAKCEVQNFFHIDVNCDLIKLGYDVYGIVKEDIVHLTSDSFYRFIRKRFRYMKQFYLKNRFLRRYQMYSSSDRRNLLRYIFFSITLIEPLSHSFKGYKKMHDIAWFLHPILCLVTLFVYGFAIIEWKFELFIERFISFFLAPFHRGKD